MNKNFFLLFALCCCVSLVNAQTNYLDNYIGATVTPTIIASSTDLVNLPTDLDFKPNSHELWVSNYGTSSGGTCVIIYNAGLPTQIKKYKKDSHSSHFMRFPSAIAFGDDGMWACTNEIKSTASATSTFMGPGFWTSDTAIFAKVFQNNWVSGLPLGSHYDMLHQSPFSMGIAHDSALAYWVNDGHNGNICLYDYVQDHGPGYDNHSAGKIWRYTDVTVTRVVGVPSHMILDKANGWLYFIDAGPKKIKRMNVNTGSITGNLAVPSTANEPLAGYKKVEGAIVEELDSLTTQPCGIDYYNNRLIVSDYTNGNIYLYNTSGTFSLLDSIVTGLPGMMGVKVGPDGRIWCVNKTGSKVYRLDIPDATIDIALTSITSPIVQNFKQNFYSTAYNVCTGSISPSATILNKGTSVITSATLQYTIDNGSPVSFSWTGSLASGATATVSFPSSSVVNGNHLLNIKAITVNGVADDIDLNNVVEGSFRAINPAVAFPFKEEFNTATFPPIGWNYIHYNPNNVMSYSSVGGFGLSTGSAKMDNFSGAEDITGQKDYLMSPMINMSSAPSNSILHFNVAHAQYNVGTNDSLEIFVSTDCGNSWTSIYNKAGAILSTTSPSTTSFVPSSTNWRTDTVSMSAFAGQPDVILSFRTLSNFGNHIYLDDINIATGPTGINDILNDNIVSISPNPVSTNLHFVIKNKLNEKAVGKIYSYDGKLVKTFTVPINETSFDVDFSTLSNGVYAITINTGNYIFTKNIIKQ